MASKWSQSLFVMIRLICIATLVAFDSKATLLTSNNKKKKKKEPFHSKNNEWQSSFVRESLLWKRGYRSSKKLKNLSNSGHSQAVVVLLLRYKWCLYLVTLSRRTRRVVWLWVRHRPELNGLAEANRDLGCWQHHHHQIFRTPLIEAYEENYHEPRCHRLPSRESQVDPHLIFDTL